MCNTFKSCTISALEKILQILNLQQDYFYSLKAIKKDKSLLKSKKSNLKKNKNSYGF